MTVYLFLLSFTQYEEESARLHACLDPSFVREDPQAERINENEAEENSVNMNWRNRIELVERRDEQNPYDISQ